MKNRFVVAVSGMFLLATSPLVAQTNVFPSSGNVGIGTTSPNYKFEVIDSAAANGIISRWTRNSKSLEIYTGSTVDLLIGTPTNSSLGFYTNNNNPVLILSTDQKVGIGTANPDAPLRLIRDIGNTAGVNDLADFTHTSSGPGNAGIALGYWANGTGKTAGAIRATGNLPLYFTTSAAAAQLVLETSGNVGIGTTSPTHKLAVNGTIRAKEVIVDTGWSDFVFADNYRLAPLSEVETHIKAERHLPGIPSAQEVADHGVSMGEMQSKLLAKIEELTLHVIAQEKALAVQTAEIAKLKSVNARSRP